MENVCGVERELGMGYPVRILEYYIAFALLEKEKASTRFFGHLWTIIPHCYPRHFRCSD